MYEYRRWVLAVGVILAVGGCDGDADGGDAGPVEDARVVMDGEPMGPEDAGLLCESDRDCDDGDFCNGAERCAPSNMEAGSDGCVAGEPPCDAETEICDETADRCDLDECSDGGDADGDGDARPACGGQDCDDSQAAVSSLNNEVCDELGVDEDCDPSTIHSEAAGAEDGDVDGDGAIDAMCFNPRPDGTENRGLDCNDRSADVRPGVLDGCDGVDTDCDGVIDEDPDRVFYEDVDGDGYGVVSSTLRACEAPPGWAVASGDCNDANRNINPGNPEICNGIDDDCSGVVDDPAAPATCDCVDGTTQACGPSTDVGACTFGTSTCVGGAWGPCVGAVSPTAETCNGADDDCDGRTDDADGDIAAGDPGTTGAITYYRDVDGDGYGDPAMSENRCTPRTGWVLRAGDCDDLVGTTHEMAAERCDGTVDDDCDGVVDEGCDCTNGATRRCGTTDVGRCQYGTETCTMGRWGACSGNIEPAPSETCDAADEDCDGLTNDADPDIAMADISVTGATIYYRDRDGDTYGDATPVRRCSGGPGWSLISTDCDDTRMHVNEGAPELCDMARLDEDCDGDENEDCFCVDGETDTCGTTDVGNCTTAELTCMSGAYPSCPAVQPETEVCGGGDEDCDGLTDDADPSIATGDPSVTGATLYYRDMDGDGRGDPAVTRRRCSPAAGWVVHGDDCDDGNSARSPQIVEADRPCDGVDNDCDGTVDEAGSDEVACYRDFDGDGFGRTATTHPDGTHCACPSGWVPAPGDCLDSNADVSPGQTRYFSAAHTGRAPGPAVSCSTYGFPPTTLCYSWDYDCSGTADPAPVGTPCLGSPGACTGRRGPSSSSHSGADCGSSVWHMGGCAGGISCTTRSAGNQDLACR
ncbi:MAG: putative metal-binding motif-containing protein [Myxococcota bacterium]|nr:putative metal-binding motif-containing protein [Myxococcota bacterium]